MLIPMIIHIAVTYFPIMAGVPVTLNAVRALPGVNPTPFIRFDTTPGVNGAVMFLVFDDIYRSVLMFVLFVVMFPFSIANQSRKRWFSLTQW